MQLNETINILVSAKSNSLARMLNEFAVNIPQSVKIKYEDSVSEQINLSQKNLLILDSDNLKLEKDQVSFFKKVIQDGHYIVLLGDLEEKGFSDQNFLALEKFKPIKIMSFIQEMLNQNEKAPSEYLSLSPNLLLRSALIPCDIYLRMSGGKYIKLFSKESGTDKEKIQKYIEKGVRYLFVKNSDFYECCTPLLEANLVDESLYPTATDAYIKTTELIHSMVTDFGVTKSVLDQVNNVANATLLLLSKDKELAKLSEVFKRPEGQYIYSHSYMTLTFSMMLLSKVDWNDKKFNSVLAQAAMLHDLGFKNPEYAIYDSGSAEALKKIPADIRAEILDHGQIMADLMRENNKISFSVLKLIERHHEGHGDDSYPRGLNGGSLSQLECLFILCHDFSVELFRVSFNQKKVGKIVDKMMKNYNKAGFKKLLIPFEKVFRPEN